jgi:hypothetical protein
MSKRKTNDADVQQVVRWINYPTQRVTLVEMTKTWSEADILYAIDRLQTDQRERQDQLRDLYWDLRMERQATDSRIASEEANAQRHNEISKRLEELNEISRRLDDLKKPHWSIVPNFWVTAIILILTAILVIVGFLTLRH